MGFLGGTMYFIYYGSLGYFTNYEKHLLWRDLCFKAWNTNNNIETNNIDGKSGST